MAVDDDDETEKEEPQKKSGSVLKSILLFTVLPLVLIGGTVGGLYFAGLLTPAGDATEEVAEDGEDLDPEDEEQGPANYLALDPAFVVNFAGDGKARFLQITVEVMSRDPEAIEAVKKHMPAIRNNLVLLFSSQTYEQISTLEGKEILREDARFVIQDILDQETDGAVIDAVYFTSIVMQ